MWKYWVLDLLLPELRHEYQMLLKKDIETLAFLEERDENLEIIEQARLCLEKCFPECFNH